MDYAHLFKFSISPAELIIRGTATFWFLFVLLRFVLRRDVGSLGIADVLLVVLIADASQNAMAGDYRTLADGFVLVVTIAGWNYAFDWAAYHSPILRRIIEAPTLELIRNGQINFSNLRHQMMTLEELRGKLRASGIEHVAEVKSARLESDGEITVIPLNGRP